MIKLGTKYKDAITGYTGTATARAEYLYDNPNIKLESSEMKDGKLVEAVWFNEQRLVEVQET